MEPQVAQGFLEAVRRLQDRITESDLRSALASGNIDTIMAAAKVGTPIGATDAAALEAALLRTSTATGKAGADVLADVTGLDAKFNASDPRVVLAAREQGATLVRRVSEEAREAVRIIVSTAQAEGLTIAQQARAIREVVPLPTPWVEAPLNLRRDILDGHASAATRRRLSAADKAQIRSRIERGTVTEDFADEMSAKYARSLTNRRALNIARTESLAAAHIGQEQGWRQAVEDEVLPTDSRRMAIVTPDDRLRLTHAQVPRMNPNGVGMDEPFVTPFGPLHRPPWEPLCRCGVGLVFPGRPGVL